MAKETAEQKLLKLIETTEAASGTTATAPATPAMSEAQKVLASVKGPGLPSFSFQGIFSFFQQTINAITGKAAGGDAAVVAFGLREVNIVLVLVVTVFLIILLTTFSSGIKLSQQAIHFSVRKNITPAVGPYFVPIELSKYLENISRRNIFQPYEPEIVEVEKPEEKVLKITEMTADLRLVGISWLDSAETATAMIEDQKTSVTHFLKMGDEINGVKVGTIYTDRVRLTMDSEETVLSL